MAYAAWSVVAGEQPTAAKWNILGTNDASFNDGSGINWSVAPTIANGLVSSKALTNPYKFSVYRNAAQNAGNNVFGKVNFDTKEFDTGSNFDAVTNFRFTAPVAGFYFFNWQVQVLTNADTAISLYKNGAEWKRGTELLPSTGTIGNGGGGATLVQAALNDFFEVFAFSPSGQALTVGAIKTYFMGFLVSQT